MKKILAILLVFLFSLTSSFAYNLTEKDYKIIDKVEDKLIQIIDSKPKYTPEKVVKIIKSLAEKKAKNEKVKEILYVIADDLEYEYYLGEYAEDDLALDDYVSEVKEKTPVVTKVKTTEKVEEDDQDYEYSEESDGYSEEDYEKMQDQYSLQDGEDIEAEQNDEYTEDEMLEENTAEDDSKTEATYAINGNSIKLISGKEKKTHKEILNILITLIPAEYRENIVKFKVYNDPEDDSYAYVDQDVFDKTKWTMVINLSTFYYEGELDYEESIHTLIHEFSHVLTLGPKQVNYKIYDDNACKNYMLAEGCLNENAYLNSFIGKFWKNDFPINPKKKYYKDGFFVTDYAATNPGEDIAESFTFFVLHQKPQSNKLVKDQKILFFYKYKELVKLRNQIRQGLAELKK